MLRLNGYFKDFYFLHLLSTYLLQFNPKIILNPKQIYNIDVKNNVKA